jgi:hypothetical protein
MENIYKHDEDVDDFFKDCETVATRPRPETPWTLQA